MATKGRWTGLIRIALSLALVIASPAPAAHTMEQDMPQQNVGYTIPEDCRFENVTGRYTRNECSPTITDIDFVGVVINAPREVFYEPGDVLPFGGFVMVPICGAYMYTLGSIPDLERNFTDAMLFVAVDTMTGASYRGKIQPRGTRIPATNGAPEKIPPEQMGQRVVGGFFNPNLTEVLQLPETEAEYFVYVTLGPFKSNVVKVKFSER